MLEIGIAGVRAVVEWCHRFFFSLKRKHRSNGKLSPVGFEVRRQKPNEAGVQGRRGAL
jgi:hypothetical protein